MKWEVVPTLVQVVRPKERFQDRRSAMDGGRRSSYMDVLVRGPESVSGHNIFFTVTNRIH